MIKTILLYIICYISLVIYSFLVAYIVTNGDSTIVKLIYSIITTTVPLIFAYLA